MAEKRMREILFRGKRKDNGEWIEGSLLCDSKQNEIYIVANYNDKVARVQEVIPETVGQYTGLNAKGKKIFEGDILDVMHQGVFECRWDSGNFEFSLSNSKESFGIAYVSPNDIFVIGNIHDNPELLERA